MTELAIIFLVATAVTAIGVFGGKLHTAHFDLGVLSHGHRRVLRWIGGIVMILAMVLIFAKAVKDVLPKANPPAEPAANIATPPANAVSNAMAPEAETNAAAPVPPPTMLTPPAAEPAAPPPATTRQPRRPPRDAGPAPTSREPVETHQPTVQNNCVISGGTNYGTQNQVCIR